MFRNEAVIVVLVAWNVLKAGYFVKKAAMASFRLAQREHDHNATRAGRIRLCWHCDNQLRDQFTERLDQWQRITVPAGCCLLCVGISV